jgi:hypothetical protein
MEVSPRRTSLYRIARCAVSFSLAFVFAGLVCWLVGTAPLHAQDLVQTYKRKDVDKGPRALGLVQIADKGKARLIPIVIMMNGKFYDAGSYKADPVPMALDFGIVYEGFRTGVSQGIFTITQPGQLSHNWIAEGTWLPAGEKAQEKTKKYAAPVIDDTPDKDDRPVLHRRAEGAADKDEAKPAGTAPPAATPPASTTPPTGTQPPSTSSAPASKDTKDTKEATKDTTKAPAQETRKADASDEPIRDPNRPILRRGKPDPNAHHEPFVNFDDPVEAAKAAQDASKDNATAAASSAQTVTAISDAGGPDPRPYTYDLKPAEEAIYRNKMFDLAATQLQAKTKAASVHSSPDVTAKGAASTSTAGARKKTPTVKTAKPQFDDVSLRIFDLSSSNEPVLVLSARTPLAPIGTPGSQVPQEITLIARTNLEGELQKLFFAETDSRHLDVSPRMELIDAVDADGDGRGELLFRRTSDAGSAYAIYRVTADGLWPLFEGTP